MERYRYDVYGTPTFLNATGSPIPASTIGNRLLFTARDRDPDTTWYNYRYRYYNPTLGRFVQPDPIGLNGGDANLYRYVVNAPVSWDDPLGLRLSSFTKWYGPWGLTQLVVGPLYGLLIDRRLTEIEGELREKGRPGDRYWFPLPFMQGAFLLEYDPNCPGRVIRKYIWDGYGSPGYLLRRTRLPWETVSA